MSLEDIFAVLKENGGYYVMTDEDGDEYMIMRLADTEEEAQLELPETPNKPDAEEILDKINRDIALYQSQEEEIDELPVAEAMKDRDDLAIDSSQPQPRQSGGQAPRPPKLVRFEPLRGDIDPDLQ